MLSSLTGATKNTEKPGNKVVQIDRKIKSSFVNLWQARFLKYFFKNISPLV